MHVRVSVSTDSHSRGLFAGLSLEGGVIIARPDVNRKFYGREVSVRCVFLSGGVYKLASLSSKC